MIPARLLAQVAQQLIGKTETGQVRWQREKHDREFYLLRQGQVELRVRFLPARVEADVIEFAVMDAGGEEIGTLLGEADDKEVYDILSKLLFAIQRADNRGGMKQYTDELLKLLPEEEREQWVSK